MRAALIFVLALSACAPTMTAHNANGGIVRLGGSLTKEQDALSAADAYCAQTGRTARITGQNLIQISFECVASSS